MNWQPISEKPKSLIPVVLCIGKDGWCDGYWNANIGRWYRLSTHRMIEPTHWCLITPPTKPDESGGGDRPKFAEWNPATKEWEPVELPSFLERHAESKRPRPDVESDGEICYYCSGPLDEPDGQACSKCLAAVLADALEPPSNEPVALPESLDCSAIDVESELAKALEGITQFLAEHSTLEWGDVRRELLTKARAALELRRKAGE